MRQVDIIAIPSIATNQSINGTPIAAGLLSRVSATITVTGAASLVGTLKLQGSNDDAQIGQPPYTSPNDPTNWADIPNTILTIAATASTAAVAVSVSSAGTVLLPANDICYKFIRPVWTYTSGSGTIVVAVHAISSGGAQ